MTPRALPHTVAARTLTTSALAASLAILSCAAAAQDHAAPLSAAPLAGGIQEMVAMPGGAWRAARVGEGDAGAVYFVSGNGRWVIKGEAYDLWAGERLRDFEAVRAATRSIRFDGLGAIWDDLDPVAFGRGDRDVVVFSDPNCPACRDLLNRLQAFEADWRVVVLQIPLLGDASGRRIREVHCAADRDAARAAVREGSRSALAPRPDCDAAPILRRIATAQMIGLQGVPFMVHDDGRFIEGAPVDLAGWLEAR
jgi:thiol:disulfide interchange protein DsbC